MPALPASRLLQIAIIIQDALPSPIFYQPSSTSSQNTADITLQKVAPDKRLNKQFGTASLAKV
jgi:hypothetical protein